MMKIPYQIKMLFKAILGASVAISIMCGILLHRQNKKLTESLKTAENNIESYQNIIEGANEENNTLKLTVEQLRNTNDSIISSTVNKIEEKGIKLSNIKTIATQNQSLYVKGGKGVDIALDTLSINDSIYFNDETKVYYTIDKDSINITLDISNHNDLLVYKYKEWKNKKSFFKRLITLDFKKVWKSMYTITNSNDLIKTSDVRVIELTE